MADPILTITPKTTGTFTIDVVDDEGNALPSPASAVAVVRLGPTVVADNVAMTYVSGNTYMFTVQPAWSTGAGGRAIEGHYTVEITAVSGGQQVCDRFAYSTTFAA